MASLGELLQRIARSLEEAREQGPADDLRARLGYGVGDDEDEYEPVEDAFGEPAQEAVGTRPIGRTPEPGTSRTRSIDWEPETVWRPPATRRPAPPAVDSRASGPARTPAPEAAPGHRRSPPAVPLRRPHAPSESALSERVRARLRTPDALREAFVVKEVLDRPLARRRRGPGMR